MKHPGKVEIYRVFTAKIRQGKIRFREECDQYFAEFLTTEEARKIAAEIVALADELDLIGKLSPPGEYD